MWKDTISNDIVNNSFIIGQDKVLAVNFIAVAYKKLLQMLIDRMIKRNKCALYKNVNLSNLGCVLELGIVL